MKARNSFLCLLILSTVFSVLSISTSFAQTASVPMSVAHRGGHIDGLIPENCPAGVAMAARYGFRAIECDVHYTADKVMILMHDGTINRTMRNASDYSEIEGKVKYADLTYADLKAKYVLASSDESLRTPIPTFEEELEACRKYGIIPMIHSDLFEAYELAHKVLGDNFIAFDANYDAVKRAREISSCLILWDPGQTPAAEAIEKLNAIGGRCGVSSMNDKLLTADYIKAVKAERFEVQSSIWPCPKEVEAVADGATIVLSDFSLFPVRTGLEKSTVAPFDRDVNAQKAGQKKIESKDLAAGETVDLSWKAVKYGSVEMMIRYSGSVEVVVNGQYHYPLPAGTGMIRIGGWRFYDQAPSFQVIAKDATKLHELNVRVYKY